MPELPEVEIIRAGVQQSVVGRRVVGAHLHRSDVCTAEDGRRCGPRALLAGDRVVEANRRGKQLALVGESGRVLVVQLGMSGQLYLAERGDQRRTDHIHAEWRLDDGSRLVFRDPRRFGGLLGLASQESLEARWATLGPDALDVSGAELRQALGRSRRAIKAGLLDQKAVAGIGNIYADEALFRAGIRPRRLCTRVTAAEYGQLAGAVQAVLRMAISTGGSTIRDYVSAAGERGRAQEDHMVYGRAGEPCLVCGMRLKGIRVAQRGTVYCPRCQR